MVSIRAPVALCWQTTIPISQTKELKLTQMSQDCCEEAFNVKSLEGARAESLGSL